MRLVLIRHAEARRGEIPEGCAAPADLGLTANGEAEAESLAAHLGRTREVDDCDAFLCSPLPRAVRTAEILADHLRLPTLKQEDAFSEISNLPGTPASGEPLPDFFARVRRAANNLVEQYAQETVVAVTHGGWIMASIRVLFDIPTPGTQARFNPKNGSITEWHVADGIWTLGRYNDAPDPPGA